MKVKVGLVSVLVVAAGAVGFALGAGTSVYRPSDHHSGAVEIDGPAAAAELGAVLEIGDAFARATALVRFLETLEPTTANAEALRKVLAKDRNSGDDLAWTLVPAWWARFNAEQALNRRLSAPKSGRWPWVTAVVRDWVRRQPQAALAAVSELSLPREYQLAAKQPLIQGWFESDTVDPSLLLDLIENTEDVRGRGDLITLFIESMTEARGVEATQAFVESMPERKYGFRREFRGRYVEALVSDGQTSRAIEWAESHYEAGDNAFLYLAARWGWIDGPSAMRWALALPPGKDRAALTERAYRSFLRRDGEAARTWIRGQEFSSALEPAYALFLMSAAKEDPEASVTLAGQIEDKARQSKVLTAVGRAWMEKDPISAKAWLEGAEMPSEVAKAILDPSQRSSSRPTRQQSRRANDGAENRSLQDAPLE